MKLNLDCVRDILLSIEDIVDYDTIFEYPEKSELPKRLKKYDNQEIMYHMRQCNLSGFFYKCTYSIVGRISIEDLSPVGHEFLANIRSDSVWNKTKDTAGKIGVFSIHALKDLSIQVVSEIIKGSLGLS